MIIAKTESWDEYDVDVECIGDETFDELVELCRPMLWDEVDFIYDVRVI